MDAVTYRQSGKERSILRRPMSGLILVALLLSIAALGCLPWGRGAYQVEIFGEMHYTQVYRSQEPPRLYPPEGSMPFKQVGDGALEVHQMMAMESTSDSMVLGEKLYAVNCLVCHGAAGAGDGAMNPFLKKWSALAPPNLTADTSVNRTDEVLFGLISEGGATKLTFAEAGVEPAPAVDRNISMPVFRKLLTEEERWALVHYVRALQSQ